jgi:hypothetical protein
VYWILTFAPIDIRVDPLVAVFLDFPLHFPGGRGYKVWESLLSRSDAELRVALDLLFPPTRLPNGESRRSHLYAESSPDVQTFVNEPDILWRSSEVQRRIFEHQNPPTCENRAFMAVDTDWFSGLGGVVLVVAMNLAGAMDSGRILVYGKKFHSPWTNDPVCGGSAKLDCFFLPLSNCTPGNNSDVQSRIFGFSYLREIPRFVIQMLNGSLIDPESYWSYWHAHTFAYVSRLNNRTVERVREIMGDSGVLSMWDAGGFDVGIHIRHTDKRREMTLVDDIHYSYTLDLVQRLRGRRLSVFLATDDPNSLAFFRNRTDIQLFTIKRPHLRYGYLNGLYYLADILAMARSTFFIGTSGSNCDRWVTWLMAVTERRASCPFLEVGDARCVTAAHCRILTGRR